MDDAGNLRARMELFRDHEAFISVVARLIEAEYRKVSAAQAQIDQRSARLLAPNRDLRVGQRAAGAGIRGDHRAGWRSI